MIIRKNDYAQLLGDVTQLLDSARAQSARSVNAILTVTYWLIGRRVIEFEQSGKKRAEYGEQILEQLADDLTEKYGRGFGKSNLFLMRSFYLRYENIFRTLSGKLLLPAQDTERTTSVASKKKQENIFQTVSGKLPVAQSSERESVVQALAARFILSWSHYARLLSIESDEARTFYEAEALRGGWTVRQLDRQIATSFYERTLLSKNKAEMLRKGAKPREDELTTAEEELRNPIVLEFLGLKNEYSESDLEEALIVHLENFLLELGGDFTFVGRQKRLRIGTEWFRIDLLFFHRKLRCLVVIDLKVGKFTHADAGQMHMYLNYAKEHWTNNNENPPVGLILCAEKDVAVAKYALEGLPNKVLAAEYRLALPNEKMLVKKLTQTRKLLERRKK